MNYRIVGADGQVYGPVGLEQIRQWLAEGRAESRTPVHVEGAREWTTVGALPELAAAVAAHPPAIGAVTAVPPSARGTNGFATAALICSLLSWLCCCCLPLNLMAIIFAIIALVQISSQPAPQEGRIFAIIAIILAVANVAFGLLAGLLQVLMNPGAIHWGFNGS
jgi:NADH:ubiquinone oxidoreductase subunit K